MKKLLLICFALPFFTIAKTQVTNDTIVIKQLLEKESATWRSGDVKAHADCWHIQPYSKIVVSTPDGKFIDVPPSFIINPPPNMVGKGGSAVNSSYTFSVHDNNAWVGHDEISTAEDGTKSYSYEVRILEKINGEWKLVAQSIHSYKP